MNYLIEIVRILKPREMRLVEKVLRTQSQTSRRWDLFKLIVADGCKTDEEASMALYARAPSSAFSHLKTRLFQNILEIIFPDNAAQIEGIVQQARYDCWRKLLLAQFLISREAFQNGIATLQEARQIAQQGDHLSELILIEDQLMQVRSQIQDEEEVAAEPQAIHAMVDALRANLDAKQATCALERLVERQNLNPLKLPDSITQLAHTFAQTYVLPYQNSSFGQVRFLLQYHLATHDLLQAAIAAQYLTQAIQDPHTDINFADRMLAYIDISKVSYLHGNESGARSALAHVFASASPQSISWLLALEQVFLIDFYAHDYARAEELLQQALAHPKLELSSFRASKWKYYEANLAYVKGNWHASLHLIQENKELFKYKSKWLLGLKILEMYNFLALGKHDLVEYKLNALKQLLKRQKDYNIGRCKYICKMVGGYIRPGLDLQESMRPQACDTQLLWMPFDYEVVDLATWMKNMDTKIPV
jgi:hypothetical protein